MYTQPEISALASKTQSGTDPARKKQPEAFPGSSHNIEPENSGSASEFEQTEPEHDGPANPFGKQYFAQMNGPRSYRFYPKNEHAVAAVLHKKHKQEKKGTGKKTGIEKTTK